MIDIKYLINKYLMNVLGWRTNRKIVIIESDDWGSIRMPSKEVYEKCLRAGYRVDLNPYERYDSLESQEDLELLFELLESFRDKTGNPPIITANCVVANPDFEKIQMNNFTKYYYELITETFGKYPKHNKNMSYWLEGKARRLFYPQFHAREHLNVSLFMKALQNKCPDTHFGFLNQMPGCIPNGVLNGANLFVEATRFTDVNDMSEKIEIYLEGLDIFKKIFGYTSVSMMPASFIWSNSFNSAIKEKGVLYIQGARKMIEPQYNGNPDTTFSRKIGQINDYGQINLLRNCYFEPTIDIRTDIVEKCISEITTAFNFKKPATISMHRINFVGFIDTKNRDKNLMSFKKLLSRMLSRWPDIEFMDSSQLGDIIRLSIINK